MERKFSSLEITQETRRYLKQIAGVTNEKVYGIVLRLARQELTRLIESKTETTPLNERRKEDG